MSADHLTPTPGDLGVLSPAWAGTPAARLADDTAVIQALLDVERAWVQVCGDAGFRTEECADSSSARADSTAWSASSYDLADLAARTLLGANVLIPLLKDLRVRLAVEDPCSAQLVHLGATSQDIIDSALMLLAARVVDEALPALDAACASLARLADAHRDTLCVARSLAQHALPSTFGLRAANWLEGLSQATADLRAVRARLPLQWAGAAGTGAALTSRLSAAGVEASASELRARLATSLGLLDAPGWHTTRLPVTRLAGALGGVLAAAGTLATDVVTGSRTEIGEVAEPAAPGRGGSSAMPHKRNPVLSVTIRSAAIAGPGHVATIFTAAGLAADERPDGAWHAEWPALRELLRLVGGIAPKLAELTAGLHVDLAALRRNLDLWMPSVLSEWAAITGADPATLDPAGYLGQSDELVTDIVRRHDQRLAGAQPPRPARPDPDRHDPDRHDPDGVDS